MIKRITLAVLLSLLNPSVSRAGSSQSDASYHAHLGMSYLLQTTLYGFSHQALTLNKTDAVFFSAFLTTAIGFTKEALDAIANDSGNLDGEDIKANLIGQGLSICTIFVFDF